ARLTRAPRSRNAFRQALSRAIRKARRGDNGAGYRPGSVASGRVAQTLGPGGHSRHPPHVTAAIGRCSQGRHNALAWRDRMTAKDKAIAKPTDPWSIDSGDVSAQLRPKVQGPPFRADIDVAELDDRSRPGPAWAARALSLSRSHPIVLSRRMSYPKRTML